MYPRRHEVLLPFKIPNSTLHLRRDKHPRSRVADDGPQLSRSRFLEVDAGGYSGADRK